MKGHKIEVTVNPKVLEALAALDAAIAAYKARESDPFAGLGVPCDDHGSEG